MDLTEFLLARIAEDEAVARAEMPQGPRRNGKATGLRRFAECDAKRRIVELHSRNKQIRWSAYCDGCSEECIHCEGDHPWPCMTVRLLALPYAGHPDYLEEWKP